MRGGACASGVFPCCDKNTDARKNDCHFKNGIDFAQMRRDRQHYKNLETKAGQHPPNYTLDINAPRTERDALHNIAVARKNWVDNYYIGFCGDCDAFNRNHNLPHEAGERLVEAWERERERKRAAAAAAAVAREREEREAAAAAAVAREREEREAAAAAARQAAAAAAAESSRKW